MAFGFTKALNAKTPWNPSQGPLFPYIPKKEPDQIIRIAEGKFLKIYHFSATVRSFSLHWDRMKETDRDNLVGFLEDATVNYGENTFTYEDSESNTYTVRLWNIKGVDFPQVGSALYVVRMTLREEV